MQLRAKKLVVLRGERTVIAGLSFSVSSGEALVLTGPNGSGKTTLIRTLAGLTKPASGEIELDIQDANDRSLAEHCHYVGHQNAVKASLTVAENAAFWWRFLADHPADRARGRAGAALDAFGLLELSHVPAGYLSAGQKRRLGLARLLTTHRPIWLLDEPTAGLDAASQGVLESVINRHLRSGGLAIIATHHPLDVSPQAELPLDRPLPEAT
ncbi:MAG TPA: heme ABC exporter ATP-binding protein CcmA [Hyphomicrobiaceae bacterium]|nr:heme ABC exporter ATP-binding protein CcmA [Hyphomicrobiaceae bacterium]